MHFLFCAEFKVCLGCHQGKLTDEHIKYLMQMFSNDAGLIEYPEFVAMVKTAI